MSDMYKAVTHRVHITSITKYVVTNAGFRLAYVHLSSTHSKGRGEGQEHIDSEYLGNGDRGPVWKNYTVAFKYEIGFYFSTSAFTFDLRPL